MAHLPPQTAIFSPSVARMAASTAKDWNFVDSWLSARFHGRPPPPFERNPDTLKALLALASLNEAADEERDLLARTEAAALQELIGRDASPPPAASPAGSAPGPRQPDLGDTVLSAIERELAREGTTSLESMAAMAHTMGIAYPEPGLLGRHLLDLHSQVRELDQMIARVDILRRFVDDEVVQTVRALRDLRGEAYRPESDLAKQNLEVQRKVKAMAAKLPEMRDRAAALSTYASASFPTIEQIAREEQAYLALLAEKGELETQLARFGGLPSDTDAARSELESMRMRLRQVTEHRDAVFEGLVEPGSPKRLGR